MMRVTVKVRAGARRRDIRVNDDGSLTVFTTVAPEKGKANADVVDMLSKHFSVAKSCVQLVRGSTSTTKTFEITA